MNKKITTLKGLIEFLKSTDEKEWLDYLKEMIKEQK